MTNLSDLFDDPVFMLDVPHAKIKYKALDVILKEKENSQDVYLILEGQVQVSTNISNSSSEFSPGLARLSKNDIFGELAMFDGEPRSAEVIALTDCEIAKFDGPKMISFLDRYPEKGYFVLRDIFMHLVAHMRQNNIRTQTVLQLYLNERG
ncbi:MAG: cyclic nucleotide-binding domain-containing protein [Methylococcales bacterium]